MRYGAAWYPEHWPRETWDRDLELMEAAHFDTVRLGEFAWSRLEPSDGRFEMAWLVEAIRCAQSHGIACVVGTPTAAPPAWLTSRHPEVLRVEPDGRRCGHGARGHYNPAHATYLGYCRRIAGAMAEACAGEPNVIGWQIDNEYWPFSYDPETRRLFQEFLKATYGALSALNAAWSTAYWSQEYDAWDQIPLATAGQNPCLIALLRRFMVHVTQRYQWTQVEAIREVQERGGKDWFITHNFHGTHQHADASVLSRDLDVASFDPYVGSGHLDFTEMGLRLDWTRGLKRGGFWIMETQPGFVNWAGLCNCLDRGESRRMVWHQIGHGADAVLWWQWRSALGGQEQYHGCLLHPNGRPRPFYAEAVEIGRELRAASQWIDPTETTAEVAILAGWDDRHAVEAQRHHREFDPLAHTREWHAAFRRQGLNADVLRPDEPLDGYRLVCAPHLHLVDDVLCDALARWVEAGGRLMLGPRSGVKNRDGALLESYPPGTILAEALGAHIEEFYALEAETPLAGALGEARAKIWGEWVQPDVEDCVVLWRYGEGHSWLKGQAACVGRRHGRGWIGYCGAWLDRAGYDALAARLCTDARLATPWAPLPEGVEVSTRTGGSRVLHVICNHGKTEAQVALPWPVECVFSGRRMTEALELPANEVAVLRRVD